jgi:virulence-associated protein VapD
MWQTAQIDDLAETFQPLNYSSSMFAIAFDLDTSLMEAHYPGDSWQNGYKEIEDILDLHGFHRQQGSVYYGDAKATSVNTVLAAQDLSRCLGWFKPCIKDIRILQLLGNDDLKPAL